MHRYILYIINPIAGTRAKKDLKSFIEEKTKAKGIPFETFPSVANAYYSFLNSVIKEKKVTDIVIAGGDGTVSQVAGSLMNQDVNFGIIPCGSGNGLALAAGISKQPAKALDIIFKEKASAIDGFYINDPASSGTGRRFACMLCGLGFDAKVAYDFADQPKRGLATYARMAMKNFFSMKPYRFRLQLDETTFETEAYFMSIANSNQFGNNFTIAPKASLSDGMLDIVIVASKNKISFILQTLRQLAGWNKLYSSSLIKEKKGVIYFQTDRLIISNLSDAPMHIDGDPAETMKELEIKMSKNCFRLIQP